MSPARACTTPSPRFEIQAQRTPKFPAQVTPILLPRSVRNTCLDSSSKGNSTTTCALVFLPQALQTKAACHVVKLSNTSFSLCWKYSKYCNIIKTSSFHSGENLKREKLFSLIPGQSTVFKVLLILWGNAKTQNAVLALLAKRSSMSFYPYLPPCFHSIPLPSPHRQPLKACLRNVLGSSEGHTIVVLHCYSHPLYCLFDSVPSLNHCQRDCQLAYSVPSREVRLLYLKSPLFFLPQIHLPYDKARKTQL